MPGKDWMGLEIEKETGSFAQDFWLLGLDWFVGTPDANLPIQKNITSQ